MMFLKIDDILTIEQYHNDVKLKALARRESSKQGSYTKKGRRFTP